MFAYQRRVALIFLAICKCLLTFCGLWLKGGKMNRGIEIRQELMRSAIRVVSTQGIQNATTKALSIDSELSEVYIYRYFQSKDDLFKQTFISLDKELMLLMKRALSHVNCRKTGLEEIFKFVFHEFSSWDRLV